MGELKNCIKCGRMFSGTSEQKFCERCRNNDEDDFSIVREYIYDNPNSTASEVAEETGVDEAKILKFLRQGRLELKGDGVGYPCERCGKSIKTGKFCEQCSEELKKEISSAFGLNKKEPEISKSKKTNTKMHIKP